MSRLKQEKRLYWVLHLCGWTGMVCIELINYTFFIVGHFDWGFVRLFCYGAFLGLVITHGFRYLIKRSRIFDWRPRTIWMIAFLSTLLMSAIMNLLFYIPSMIENRRVASELFTFIGLLGGTINWMRYVGVWVIIYFMYHILERSRKIEEEKLKSENLARMAELELLKTQLNPHFLFNALNSIKALVSIDQEKSKDAIVKLSELLRFTLNYGNQVLIPLHDEIDEVKKYLSLEQIRFGSRLELRYDVEDSTLNKLVPPAIILTLAENAIKHGIAKQSGTCQLQLNARLQSATLCIEMVNPGRLDDSEHKGIGLQNIKKRLHHFYGARSSFRLEETEGKVLATITIAE